MNSLDQSKNRTIRNTDIEKIKSYLVKSLTTESVGLGLTEEERREELHRTLERRCNLWTCRWRCHVERWPGGVGLYRTGRAARAGLGARAR